MRLFPATKPLESVAVNILRPLPKTKSGNRFILEMAARFTKHAQVAQLKRKTGLDVANAFVLYWVFKYGAPKKVLSDNGPTFASKM